jgi:hypothetical protein
VSYSNVTECACSDPLGLAICEAHHRCDHGAVKEACLQCENARLRAEVERLRGERGQIVAWLRGLNVGPCLYSPEDAADMIERGDHLARSGGE